MKKILFTTAAVCCIITCFAIAATLAGKWTAVLKTQDGSEFPLTYNFKVDGDKLTGTIESQQGTMAIENGKINGSDFSFTVNYNGDDIKNTGKFYAAADSAGIDIDINSAKMHVKLMRAK